MQRAWMVGLVVVALAAGAVVGYVIGTSASTSSAREFERTVRDTWEGPDDLDKLEQVLAFYADDGIMDDLAAGEHFEGHDELEWATQAFLSTEDLDVVVEDFLVGQDWAVSRWRASGTGPSGAEFDLPGISLYELDSGRVSHEYTYYDMTQAPR